MSTNKSSSNIIIDSHVHCGKMCKLDPRNSRPQPQAFEDYVTSIRGTNITGAVMFSPVPEIYDRLNPEFKDDASWQSKREASNRYILSLKAKKSLKVLPFFFIWNDFAIDQITNEFYGIKWHRHADEPEYLYDAPECEAAIKYIEKQGLPIILEETFANTKLFLDRLNSNVPVIIPHVGLLNGGYERLADIGVWSRKNVYTDTSAAAPETIQDFLETYDDRRIFFGSDFPFGDPKGQLKKCLALGLAQETENNILFSNITRLLIPFTPTEKKLRDGRIIRIRALQADDGERFLGFTDGLSAQSRDFMHGWTELCAPQNVQEHARKRITNIKRPDYRAIVAVVNDPQERIIGYCWIEGLGDSDIPMLGIGVIDEFHGHALGQKLIQRMVQWAGRLGADRVRLGVFSDNVRGLHVYRKLGFVEDPDMPAKDFDGRTELYLAVETARHQ